MYVLSEENLSTIVAIAAEEGIRSYKAEQDRSRKSGSPGMKTMPEH